LPASLWADRRMSTKRLLPPKKHSSYISNQREKNGSCCWKWSSKYTNDVFFARPEFVGWHNCGLIDTDNRNAKKRIDSTQVWLMALEFPTRNYKRRSSNAGTICTPLRHIVFNETNNSKRRGVCDGLLRRRGRNSPDRLRGIVD
jgi:hypothetical protein